MSATIEESLQLVKEPEAAGMYMKVFVAGPNRETLAAPAALAWAKKEAGARGFNPRSLTTNSPNIYPVNKDGECTAGCLTGADPIARWVGEFEFCAGL